MWRLDDKGDLILDNNIKTLSKLSEQVAQRLQLKLSIFNGEWFIHEEQGLDWLPNYEDIGQLGKKLRQFNLKEQIKAIIESEPYVDRILFLNLEMINGTGELKIDAQILLKNGEKMEL